MDRRIRTIDGLRGFAPLALVATLSCGDGAIEPPPPDPPRPTTVTVTPATTQLAALGATVQLSAEVRDQNGQVMAGAAVTWSSSDPSVATVDAQGLVTAAGNGTATITATAGSASGTATVMVAQEVSTVAVSPAADTLVTGDTLRLGGGGHRRERPCGGGRRRVLVDVERHRRGRGGRGRVGDGCGHGRG